MHYFHTNTNHQQSNTSSILENILNLYIDNQFYMAHFERWSIIFGEVLGLKLYCARAGAIVNPH